ncbi:EAL domain-containing protein [Pseudomonas sp. 32.2.56]|uniref:EAL domain-containing protein n=1 Tax=Pseudomonas sp. 32.2.56 TaxID=2969303 RepID=UPI00214FED90|nr:EAL domain-containing protein [Pseudomonas sp. 32.2.56]MCR4509397.1 EAL domain-containing protein [Pseudomonas sp. 32.2.56]
MPKAARWELKFSTRIALLFGVLGMVAISMVMVYSLRTAEANLQSEIRHSLAQYQRTLVSQVETRLQLLEVYLHSASARRTVSALSEQTLAVEELAADVAFMFQDANIDSRLELFFLLDPTGQLVMDAGLPLHNIKPLVGALRAPLHYVQGWSLVEVGAQSALLKATPIFDPATVQLRGYLFVGLALGQNRAFLTELSDSTSLDLLVLGHAQQALMWQGDSTLGLRGEAELTRLARDGDGLYVQRFPITLSGVAEPFWLTLGVSDKRFASVYDSYLQSFLLVSSGFLLLLLVAAWLLRVNHDRAINQLLGFIEATQAGERGLCFQPTGIYEYNRVGVAMQHMVEDLHIAATVFESAEGMLVTDAQFVVLRANPAFSRMSGYSESEVVGKPLDCTLMPDSFASNRAAMQSALAEQGAWQGEMLGRRKNAQEYPQWLSIAAVRSGGANQHVNYVITLADTTQRKAAEQRIEQLAYYDPLTSLPNRRLQHERLERALQASENSRQRGAVLFIDLDNFKILNDARGHDIGDQLLQQVAERLSGCVRQSDSVARIGGDEFVILLENLGIEPLEAAQLAESIAGKILFTLRQPFSVGGVEHFSTLSIGIAMFNGTGEPLDDLLKQADLAMYQAKAQGRNTSCFFEAQMQQRVMQRASLESDLRQGLLKSEFILYYQAQIDQRAGLQGAEVLLRWQHPQRGLLTPGEIIPIAEGCGLILPLGEWVLQTACATLAQWGRSAELRHLSLSVNVSAKQLQQPDFVEQVLHIVQRSGCNPGSLKLEITESMLLDGREAVIAKMARLKAYGLRFALDDFGTGYSSLSYLKTLPLDQLKIDRSFVCDLLSDNQDADIACTIVSLAHALKLDVIAEGVETQAQCERLSSYGCTCFQGYYFGRPVPLEQLFAAAATEPS